MKSSIHDQIAKQIGEIEQGRIRRHVETLAGFGPRSVDDPATVQKTLAYLEDQLVTFGYAVSREPFGAEPYEFNLLASTVGKELPNSIVELGGHYDTVRGSPGADDNGSAVAGVLEIARVLRVLLAGARSAFACSEPRNLVCEAVAPMSTRFATTRMKKSMASWSSK